MNRKIMDSSPISSAERRRRKREFFIIISVIVIVAILTFAENRVIHFGAGFPISNTILMFILININLLLLILLIFLVLRNVVKLLYDRKRKVMGAKLRTKLVVAFIALTLLPTIVLFFFSINFITTSIEFWFNVPVEQALENFLERRQKHLYLCRGKQPVFPGQNRLSDKNKKALRTDKPESLVQLYPGCPTCLQYRRRGGILDQFKTYDLCTHARARRPAFKSRFPPPTFQQKMSPNKVRTISENHPEGGSWSGPSGRYPSASITPRPKPYLVLNDMIPPDLSEKMLSISRGFEEYQQIKLLKRPIQIDLLYHPVHCRPAGGVLCRLVRFLSGQIDYHSHHGPGRRHQKGGRRRSEFFHRCRGG